LPFSEKSTSDTFMSRLRARTLSWA